MSTYTGRKILVYVGAVTALQVGVLGHYNSLLTHSDHIAVAGHAKAVNTAPRIQALHQHYPLVAVSDDNTMAAALDANNVLLIEDLIHGKDVAKVTNAYPVKYMKWVQTQSLLVGESPASGEILLKSIDPSTGTDHVIHTFTGLSAQAKLMTIAFSAYTNDVYLLIGTDASTTVYHFDTNGTLNVVLLGGRYVKNLAVSQTGNILYFEDYAKGSFNVLKLDGGSIHLIQRDRALIGLAGNDLYVGTLDRNGLVTAVYRSTLNGEQLVKTLPLPTLAADISLGPNGTVQVQSN